MPKKTNLPCLVPTVRIAIVHFIVAIENADFFSRQFNVVLPELLIEALRIEKEAHL